MDGANVVFGLSLCGTVSRERRGSTTRTVLGAARPVQVPHDEIAIPRACQYLVVVIFGLSESAKEGGKERPTAATPGDVSACTFNLESTAIPEVLGELDAMSTEADGRLLLCDCGLLWI